MVRIFILAICLFGMTIALPSYEIKERNTEKKTFPLNILKNEAKKEFITALKDLLQAKSNKQTKSDKREEGGELDGSVGGESGGDEASGKSESEGSGKNESEGSSNSGDESGKKVGEEENSNGGEEDNSNVGGEGNTHGGEGENSDGGGEKNDNVGEEGNNKDGEGESTDVGEEENNNGGEEENSNVGEEGNNQGGEGENNNGGEEGNTNGGEEGNTNGGEGENTNGGEEGNTNGGEEGNTDGGEEGNTNGGEGENTNGGEENNNNGGEEGNSNRNSSHVWGYCGYGVFQCQDGKCVNVDEICNGFPSCSKGEDELFCSAYFGMLYNYKKKAVKRSAGVKIDDKTLRAKVYKEVTDRYAKAAVGKSKLRKLVLDKKGGRKGGNIKDQLVRKINERQQKRKNIANNKSGKRTHYPNIVYAEK